MCACLCLLFMHAVQLHISCEFVCVCVQCVVHCVFHQCVCECVCMWITDCIDMSMNKWINEHVMMQIMKDHFFVAQGQQKRFLARQSKDCLGQQKRLLARQSILQRRFLPMCQNAHSKKMVVALIGLECFLCKCNCSSPLFDLAT